MDRKLQVLLIAGIIITAIATYFSIYTGGIVFIIFAAVIMSCLIMQDSAHLPEITAELSDDAKAVVIRNTGNETATAVHVALVPENIEFDIPALAVDESFRHPLDQMIENVKVVVTFENAMKNSFSRSFQLSAYGERFDPLKPMIPLFRWK